MNRYIRILPLAASLLTSAAAAGAEAVISQDVTDSAASWVLENDALRFTVRWTADGGIGLTEFRNKAAGSLSKRLGLEEGTPMRVPVLEFCYKNDDLGDPMINDYHIAAMELATKDEMAQIAAMALKVNELLTAYLKDLGIELIDFKLEFGRFNGEILLADEISPDTCRFWDSKTGEKLDKDRFRRDLGHVEDAYQEILRRLMGGHEE